MVAGVDQCTLMMDGASAVPMYYFAVKVPTVTLDDLNVPKVCSSPGVGLPLLTPPLTVSFALLE